MTDKDKTKFYVLKQVVIKWVLHKAGRARAGVGGGTFAVRLGFCKDSGPKGVAKKLDKSAVWEGVGMGVCVCVIRIRTKTRQHSIHGRYMIQP